MLYFLRYQPRHPADAVSAGIDAVILEDIVLKITRGFFRSVALAGLLAGSLWGAGGAVAQSGGPGGARPEGRPAPKWQPSASVPTDQIIIKFKPASENDASRASITRVAAVRQALGVDVAFARDMSGDASVFKLPARQAISEVSALTDKLMSRAAELEIEYAEPDVILQATGAPQEAESPLLTPNDSFYNMMWHLKGVSADNYGANLPGAREGHHQQAIGQRVHELFDAVCELGDLSHNGHEHADLRAHDVG